MNKPPFEIYLVPQYLQALIANADKVLLELVANYEWWVEQENKMRDEYAHAENDYNREYYKELLLALAKKEVAVTIARDICKAKIQAYEEKLRIAEVKLKSTQKRCEAELEKINAFKRLLDYRNKLGG